MGLENVPLINEGEVLTSSMQFAYLFNSSSNDVPLLRVDARGLISDITLLKAEVAALEAALAH